MNGGQKFYLWFYRAVVALQAVGGFEGIGRSVMWLLDGNGSYALQDAAGAAVLVLVGAGFWRWSLRPLEALRRKDGREARALAVAALEKELGIGDPS